MANKKKKTSRNADGNFFVDTTCINCDACRKIAPRCFSDDGNYSYVQFQPKTKDEILQAQQALLACPVGSIGMERPIPLKEALDSFPIPITKNIYLNGFNSKSSYGADSYFIQSEKGNWLIDSPRFTAPLVKKFKTMGGIGKIFLTHRDDVADAHKYAKEFGAQRIIHAFERSAQPDAEIVLKGDTDHQIDKAKIIFTPGHTEGHMVLLWDEKYLFTGDHFTWISSKNDFGSFRNSCWYDWNIQKTSVEKLKVLIKVIGIFPGHGQLRMIKEGSFPEIIVKALEKM